ncbi:hypothetical protein AVEN_71913-1 [Araneus ventricosus]|uniref:Uncharacterized protein n=1 Tax=Araneus ventricosus TaxID=182803 RepID=A0A4Y2VKT0_ARAVE|nr:hypothetical protein AVEN_71913-1 [Araneus ventricosus]
MLHVIAICAFCTISSDRLLLPAGVVRESLEGGWFRLWCRPRHPGDCDGLVVGYDFGPNSDLKSDSDEDSPCYVRRECVLEFRETRKCSSLNSQAYFHSTSFMCISLRRIAERTFGKSADLGVFLIMVTV